jgi:hypothetical protein
LGEEQEIEVAVDLARHLRACLFAFLSFTLALIGYYWFSLGRWQAVGYCAAVFITLTLLNHRTMLSKVEPRVPTASR